MCPGTVLGTEHLAGQTACLSASSYTRMRKTITRKQTNTAVTRYKCFEGKKGSETEERGPLLRGWLRKPSLRLKDKEGPFRRAEGSAPEASRTTRSVQDPVMRGARQRLWE